VLDHRSRITLLADLDKPMGDSGAQAMESLTTSELRVLIAGWSGFAAAWGRFFYL